MDTFKITGYNAATDTATVVFFVGGTTYPAIKLQGIPHDTTANVKAFLRAYVDNYLAGKAQEAAAAAGVSTEVAALLNTATGF